MADIKVPVKINGQIKPDNNVEALLSRQLAAIEKQLAGTEKQNKDINNFLKKIEDTRTKVNSTNFNTANNDITNQIERLQLEKAKLELQAAKLSFQEREKLSKNQLIPQQNKNLFPENYNSFISTGLSVATLGAINPVVIQKFMPQIAKFLNNTTSKLINFSKNTLGNAASGLDNLFKSSPRATEGAVEKYEKTQIRSRLDTIIEELKAGKTKIESSQITQKDGFFSQILKSLGGLVDIVGKGILGIVAGGGAKMLIDMYLKDKQLEGVSDWLTKILPWAAAGYVAGGAKGALMGAALGFVNTAIDKLFTDTTTAEQELNGGQKEDLTEATVTGYITGLTHLTVPELKTVLKGASFGMIVGGARGMFLGGAIALGNVLYQRWKEETGLLESEDTKGKTFKGYIKGFLDQNKAEIVLSAALFGMGIAGWRGAAIASGIALISDSLVDAEGNLGITIWAANELEKHNKGYIQGLKSTGELALSGALLGFGIAGWRGAAIGAIMGIVTGGVLELWKSRYMAVDEVGDIDWKKNAQDVLGVGLYGAIAGAAIGMKFGGWKGALAGAVLGFSGLSLVTAGMKLMDWFTPDDFSSLSSEDLKQLSKAYGEHKEYENGTWTGNFKQKGRITTVHEFNKDGKNIRVIESGQNTQMFIDGELVDDQKMGNLLINYTGQNGFWRKAAARITIGTGNLLNKISNFLGRDADTLTDEEIYAAATELGYNRQLLQTWREDFEKSYINQKLVYDSSTQPSMAGELGTIYVPEQTEVNTDGKVREAPILQLAPVETVKTSTETQNEEYIKTLKNLYENPELVRNREETNDTLDKMLKEMQKQTGLMTYPPDMPFVGGSYEQADTL